MFAFIYVYKTHQYLFIYMGVYNPLVYIYIFITLVCAYTLYNLLICN